MSIVLALAWSSAAFAAEAPPVAPVKPVTENFFGTEVTDPYRWMEESGAPEFMSWIKGEADYTRSVLDRIPGRDALLKRVVALDNAGILIRSVQIAHGKYLYEKTVPGAANYSLTMRVGRTGKETVLVDPEKLGSEGHHVALDWFSPSADGHYVAYGLSEGGSEASVLHLIDLDTGKPLPDVIDRARFAQPSWLPDGKSFFYTRTLEGAAGTDKYKNLKVYKHVLGTDPAQDPLILAKDSTPSLPFGDSDFPFVGVTPGSDVAVAILVHGVLNEHTVFTAPLAEVGGASTAWHKVADVEDDVTGEALHGHALYLLSHKDAPRFKVLKLDAAQPDLAKAETVVPPSEVVIRNIAAAGDALYIDDLDGGISETRRLPYEGGRAGKLDLPIKGSIAEIFANPTEPGITFSLESWVVPRGWYQYDPKTRKVSDTGLLPKAPIDVSPFTSEEIKVKGADGVEIPVSIVHKKDLKLDGERPTWLTAYGSYGITLNPTFAPRYLALLEKGGVWAIAHVRGGGEYGEDWHKAGQKLTKQNTISDLVSAAQYLIAQHYTSSATLAINGGSAGGITVGGAETQHPELFRVVLDDVGVTDALRGEFSENGPPNIPEFGSVKTEDGFKGLFAMDAYQHVKDGTAYPATLITTGINDPRVPSWEPSKYAARLQAANSSGRPILLRVDFDAGHGMGSTKLQRDQEFADKLAFMFWQFGLPDYQPKPAG
ncbi:MAG TPA: prolyl oligopeptidase family serine peptidase [Aliidongia sp.]|nr:prolyl oligopeptidase family serine peptidase [Aliidongia sp.]